MAQIQKGTTYSTGDQVTATNLNALADAAILLPGAITDQTAKTVPLAADTVLIHSAADTALRKSTLTQLFSNATGIPISTGISGLGTGIATALAINTGSAGAPVLFNGALGTPTSGTVTNLTGTASININGTVGATTPSTGVFSSLSASNFITSTRSQNDTSLRASFLLRRGAGTGSYGAISSIGDGADSVTSVAVDINGTAVSTFNISGGNGAWGATTPAQGNFTFLFQGTAGAQGLGVGFSGAAGQGFSLRDTTNSRTYFFTTETSTGLQINAGANPISLIASSVAVTGALSASGSITATSGVILGNDNSFLYDSGTGAVTLRLGASGPYGSFLTNFGDFMVDGPSGTLALGAGGSRVATISSTGLAVTGALSATGDVGIGAAPNAGFALDITRSGVDVKQRMANSSSGNVQISMTTVGQQDWAFGVDRSDSGKFKIAASGAVASSTAITLTASGAVRFNTYGAGALTTDASGNITAASDERIKSNIRPFSRGLAEILAINPILHGYTEESGLDQSRDDYAGFSAQQVQPLIPEAIGENANGMLSFSDRPVMAALVNAMKELNANLVAQVAALSQRLAALEKSN
jgi:hypothetical protein